jgi:hypothetical protein
MGDIADMMIEGDACQQCGVPFLDGESPGYPRKCEDCKRDESKTKPRKKKKR